MMLIWSENFEFNINNMNVIILKESLDVMVKLFPYDLVVTSSSHKNCLLQCRVKLRIIDPSPESHISRSFVHRDALYIA